MKKFRLLFFVSFVLVSKSFCLPPIKTGDSLKDSALQANRRTALRCISLAENCLMEKDWHGAVSQANLGIAYDETISDLWYILASAKSALGENNFTILPLVEKSLENNNWVNYNRDNARLMYADILCDTGRFGEVEKILDESPKLFSADSEFIRTKAYYRIGDKESISRARNKIDGARRIYPKDTRFPLLFFKYENPLDDNADVRRLSKYFIKEINQFVEASPDKDAELEIYAASFAQDEDAVHLLKSFSARELVHPLYAPVALRNGLISQEDAFNYLADFADSSIDMEILTALLDQITQKEVLRNAKEYFTSYSGVILQDTDSDGIVNLYVKYSRGRPEQIYYDENQDGNLEWKIYCDFGLPVSAEIFSEKVSLEWNEFPFLSKVTVKDENNFPSEVEFSLVREVLQWTPVLMEKDYFITEKTGFDFFFPAVKNNIQFVSNESLVASCSSFSMDSKEQENARIAFTVLDGKVECADYTRNGVLYAHAQFENNLPVLRSYDADNDGVFETTEYYSIDENEIFVHSAEDERSIMTKLFGVPSEKARFYLSLVQVDTDRDSVPDFTEEYSSSGEQISSWDTDGDGKWNVRNIRFAFDEKDGNVEEEALFYDFSLDKIITIHYSNGIPVAVAEGNEVFDIEKDKVWNFYWIGLKKEHSDEFYSQLAEKALEELNKSSSNGESLIVESENVRILAVKCNSLYAGKEIPFTDYSVDENEGENEEN